MEVRNRYARPYRRRRKSIFRLIIIFLIIIGFGIYTFEFRLRPLLAEVATSKAHNIALSLISRAINEKLTEEGIDYNDIVKLEKGASGNVTALITDTVKLNMLQSRLAESILQKMKIEQVEASLPIGNLINGELLTGRGPRLHFKLVPFGNVVTDIENLFTAAGINQTRHQIMLNVNVTIGILLPISSVTTEVKTSVCIAETVIVGSVPEAYTSIDEFDRGTVDNINDYGAQPIED